jgi:hypothetical protein
MFCAFELNDVHFIFTIKQKQAEERRNDAYGRA